jgi:benzoyl-CoA reductase/2-hydroxyglutaryl-CoA dehydratase subunit BcrC/BadD/HgdB
MSSQDVQSFLEIRDQNMLFLKEAKEKGLKVLGIYCTYGPRELALAADAISVGLCGTKEDPIPAAEKDLPRNLCPLIKSSYGFAVSDTCPYFHFSDLILGETTCDGKKKMFELMNDIKPVHVMNMPQEADSQASLDLMYSEMKRLKEAIEKHFEVTITEEKLRQAIHMVNEEKRAMKKLFDVNMAKPALITGLDLLKVSFQIGFHNNSQERVSMVDNLADKILKDAETGAHVGDIDTPRIILTGVPVGMGSEKVVALIEECGGLVINMENCTGYKTLNLFIDEEDDRDPLLLLAEKYIKIPCSVMSPNTGRFDLLGKMSQEFKADGIIDLSWQGCHTYSIEANKVDKFVKDELHLPFMHLESDYSQNDRETLRLRISAFLEMVKERQMSQVG